MLTINAKNVNDALPLGRLHLRHSGVPVTSRGMDTVEYPMPVATTYLHPDQCVLFDPLRDANPFFHFFEALWILAGSEDVKPMAMLLPRLADYSDDGIVFHGAYGYRLRHSFGFDQLDAVVKLLLQKPDTRRAVVALYNPALDLDTDSKDIPCNDLIMFSIRNGKLNMMVCNRSNDMIWGCYGANAVQFGVLQQYIAVRVCADLGTYVQLSNSFHVYTDNPYWMATAGEMGVCMGEGNPYNTLIDAADPDPGALTTWDPLLWLKPELLDADISRFVQCLRNNEEPDANMRFHNMLLSVVAVPMWMAFRAHKRGDRDEALEFANRIYAADWRTACLAWLQRRYDKGAA